MKSESLTARLKDISISRGGSQPVMKLFLLRCRHTALLSHRAGAVPLQVTCQWEHYRKEAGVMYKIQGCVCLSVLNYVLFLVRFPQPHDTLEIDALKRVVPNQTHTGIPYGTVGRTTQHVSIATQFLAGL